MQFSAKLFVSLVLPAAITIIISFLWLRKKTQEEEDLAKLEEVGKGEQTTGSNATKETGTDSEFSEETFDNVPCSSHRFHLEKQLSTTESAQQDSGKKRQSPQRVQTTRNFPKVKNLEANRVLKAVHS